jgi:hypothetical protein
MPRRLGVARRRNVKASEVPGDEVNPTIAEIEALSRQPVTFVERMLGGKLWGKQQEIAQSLVDNRTTAVRSCHGSGKTHLSARLALWWLFTRPYSAVITTAPTGRQVTELLWKEIRVAYKNARAKLGGDLLPRAPKLTVDDDWLCIGFSTDDPVNFQGWHSPGGTLAIFDEAPGVDPLIWETIEGVLVGDRDRHLVIGNPVEPSGPFFDIFQRESRTVKKFHISAFDVPNVDRAATNGARARRCGRPACSATSLTSMTSPSCRCRGSSKR